MEATKWLRLAPEDVVLMEGIVNGHKERASGKWPRLDRLLFDLEVMMREQDVVDHG